MKLIFRTFYLAFFTITILMTTPDQGYSQICSDPANVIYGLTASAAIHPISVSTGTAAPRINPIGGSAGSYANAMGYNNLNGKLYYFKTNIYPGPQQFVSYDPATGIVSILRNCPSTSIVNLGCLTANGLGYYCLDAQGKLFYYRIASNTWITVTSNIRDQYGVSIATVISTNSRVMGDFAIDGSGNLWIVISGDVDFGFYRLNGPLPTTPVATVIIQRYLPPTTVTPSGKSFGGIAFNNTGQIFLSTNSGDNRLYRMETNLTLTYLSTLSIDGLGNDLTSCNFPLALLTFTFQSFSAALKHQNAVSLTWRSMHTADIDGYSIEHSMDAIKWEAVGNLLAGSNEVAHAYNFTHQPGLPGKHYYRIRENGKFDIKYSEVRMIGIKSQIVISVWPNPAQHWLNINCASTKNIYAVRLNLFNNTGKKIKEVIVHNGKNHFDISSLPAGIYVVKIEYSDGSDYNEKLVKL